MSDKTPLVSVLTLAYNQAPYIRGCLDGILMQKTNFAFELLIHDDASTDGTADIIREYEAKYPDIIKPIYQKENQYTRGGKIMERFMYPRVKGKYIAFCEGDDYWTDSLKLQKQVDLMEANEDIPCCFHRVDILHQNENKFEKGSLPKFIKEDDICEGKFFTNEDRLEKWFAYILAIMFRSKYIDYLTENSKKYKFTFNDNHIIYYLMKDSKAYYFKDSMAIYRINDGGIFGDMNKTYKLNYSYNLTKEMYEIENNSDTQKYYNKSIINLFHNYIDNREYFNAIKFIYKHYKFNAPSYYYYIFKCIVKSIILMNKEKFRHQLIKLHLYKITLYIYVKVITTINLIRNLCYKYFYKKPNVLNSEETIKYIMDNKCSVSRFGDGELYIIDGGKIGFQENNSILSNRLKEIIYSKDRNILVCIPDVFRKTSQFTYDAKSFWDKHLRNNRSKWCKSTNMENLYGDTNFTRFYIDLKDKSKVDKYIKYVKKIWDNRDIVFVEGQYSRLGYGNDLFDNGKSIKRILCPAENAFNKYNEILNSCLELDKTTLILIALGPTASVLAYDLAKNDYQAIDIGHIDIEYEWYRMGTTKKCAIKNKYVNETNNRNCQEITDSIYKNEIIKKII